MNKSITTKLNQFSRARYQLHLFRYDIDRAFPTYQSDRWEQYYRHIDHLEKMLLDDQNELSSKLEQSYEDCL